MDDQHIDEDLKQYSCVLLSGCACLGISHLGFLLVLHKLRKLRFLKYFCGTSIGSIIGLLFLLEIEIDHIFAAFSDHCMIELLNMTANRHVHDVDSKAIASSDYVIAHLIDILLSFKKCPDITFQQLYETSGVVFIVTASKLQANSFTPEYFSCDHHPKMRIIDAINASICVPVLFPVVSYEQQFYIDGALVGDLPFAYVHNRYKVAFTDMIAHSPSTDIEKASDINHSEQNKSWIDLLSNILRYTRTQMRNHNLQMTRTVFTPLDGGALDFEATPQELLYYFHKAIQFTNLFIHSKRKLVSSDQSSRDNI